MLYFALLLSKACLFSLPSLPVNQPLPFAVYTQGPIVQGWKEMCLRWSEIFFGTKGTFDVHYACLSNYCLANKH